MFNKFITTSKIPADAKQYSNGDYLLVIPYEEAKAAKTVMFYYYEKSKVKGKEGIKFVKSFGRGAGPRQYNWLKVNGKLDPNYSKKQKATKTPTKKAAKKVASIKSKTEPSVKELLAILNEHKATIEKLQKEKNKASWETPKGKATMKQITKKSSRKVAKKKVNKKSLDMSDKAMLLWT